jgi:hypothetical protein
MHVHYLAGIRNAISLLVAGTSSSNCRIHRAAEAAPKYSGQLKTKPS